MSAPGAQLELADVADSPDQFLVIVDELLELHGSAECVCDYTACTKSYAEIGERLRRVRELLAGGAIP